MIGLPDNESSWQLCEKLCFEAICIRTWLGTFHLLHNSAMEIGKGAPTFYFCNGNLQSKKLLIDTQRSLWAEQKKSLRMIKILLNAAGDKGHCLAS